MEVVLILIKTAAAIVFGFFAGHGAVYVFNKIPAKWLCDYGEKPGPDLTDPYVQRIKGYPWKWVFSSFFAAGGIYLTVMNWQFAAAAGAACWAFLMIALADGKYGIIPDQFVILLCICAFGFIPFHKSFYDPIWGMLLGGGVMLLCALFGRLVSGEEAMGMGDVKLMAAAGLAMGPVGTAAALIFAAVVSGVYFAWGVVRKKWGKKDKKPLAPFLSAGAMIYIVFVWLRLGGRG